MVEQKKWQNSCDQISGVSNKFQWLNSWIRFSWDSQAQISGVSTFFHGLNCWIAIFFRLAHFLEFSIGDFSGWIVELCYSRNSRDQISGVSTFFQWLNSWIMFLAKLARPNFRGINIFSLVELLNCYIFSTSSLSRI